jgi:hypothetical protein
MDTTKLVIGSTIAYVLPLSQRPTHPKKLWRGRITAVFIRNNLGAVRVNSLEPGYEGQSELVHLYQIRAIGEGVMT